MLRLTSRPHAERYDFSAPWSHQWHRSWCLLCAGATFAQPAMRRRAWWLTVAFALYRSDCTA
eukprot:1946611-Pyramimonas_sp.AAC.1